MAPLFCMRTGSDVTLAWAQRDLTIVSKCLKASSLESQSEAPAALFCSSSTENHSLQSDASSSPTSSHSSSLHPSLSTRALTFVLREDVKEQRRRQMTRMEEGEEEEAKRLQKKREMKMKR